MLLAGLEAPTSDGMDYRNQVHDAFQELAQHYQVPLIPFVLKDVAGIPSLNQSDGIHPNAEGERIMTQTIFRALKPLLAKN